MKLSDFRGEEAVEVLADLMTPITNIINDPKVKTMVKGGEVRLKIAEYLLKEHSKDILAMYCILNRTTEDTATPVALTQTVLEVMNDKELLDLFTSQARNTDNEYSGSVTENTEASET